MAVKSSVLLLLIAISMVCAIKFEERLRWQELPYAWPSEAVKEEATRSNVYIPYNNNPLGLEVWQDKLFLTVPRWKDGVASSLNYVKLDGNKSPVLFPYPNWDVNTIDGVKNETGSPPNDYKIVSALRAVADRCDRLWVIDTGVTNYASAAPRNIQLPTIFIYDLKTDQLIRKYPIPQDQVVEDAYFANIVVDVEENDCDNAYAYTPDLRKSLVVYSFKDNKSWKIQHNYFHFDPLRGEFKVSGIEFQWQDGIFGLALGDRQPDGSRKVYFHAFCSTKEFEVSNRVLQNQTWAENTDAYYDFKLVGDRGPNGQAQTAVYHSGTGVLFYPQVNKDAIGCWNTRKPLNADNNGLVDSDSDALVFPNDVKLDKNDNLWVLTDRLPVFLYSSLRPNEYNYRILTGNVTELIYGTPCAD